MNKIKYFIQSLERPERLEYIEKNKKIIQNIEIYKSINGYNIDETCNEFYKSGLKYTELHKDYETYGTLANYLTKINAFKYQIENNIEYMCLIEDDLILDKDFPKFIEDNLHFLEEYNILQLDEWGEGYITSLEGAKNVLNDMELPTSGNKTKLIQRIVSNQK